jgi:rRNA maturation RNase YbeY
LNVRFYYDQIKYRIRKAGEIKKFLGKVISDENKIPGDLIFIFTSDERLLEINIEFLKHRYYTDVISFDYSSGDVINGEIYNSIETVKKNAEKFKTTVLDELLRVMIHGVLHLCGYRDKSVKEKNIMNSRQELRLKEFKGKS